MALRKGERGEVGGCERGAGEGTGCQGREESVEGEREGKGGDPGPGWAQGGKGRVGRAGGGEEERRRGRGVQGVQGQGTVGRPKGLGGLYTKAEGRGRRGRGWEASGKGLGVSGRQRRPAG